MTNPKITRIRAFIEYHDIYHVGYRLYSLSEKNFIATNDAIFVPTSALNSLVTNKQP